MKKLLIFDGNSIVNRAFYGVRLLTNAKGQYTNAVHGFFHIYLKFLEEEAPDYVAVAFDLKAPTFRHLAYDGYKAQRKGMPEELAEQMPYVKDILDCMHVCRLQQEGFEADDIIGTVSLQCEENDVQCVIVTGDKDDLQLASQKTTVRLVVTRGGNTETTDFDDQKVKEVYGVTPQEFIDVKALMGDPSDNIPGVAGIGEKSAFSLIGTYHSLDGVYTHLEELKGAQKTKLENGKDMAYLSRHLSEIVRDVPLKSDFSDYAVKPYDNEALFSYLSGLELKKIIARLHLEEIKPQNRFSAETKSITSKDELRTLLQKDTVYYLTTYADKQLTSFAVLDGAVHLLRFATAFDVQPYLDVLQAFLENKNIKKVSHDIKKDMVFFKQQYDISYRGEIFDTMIAAYLVQPSRSSYALSELAAEYADAQAAEEDQQAALLPIIAEKTAAIIREREQTYLFYEVELPLVFVLASMEIEGFRVDKEKLSAFSDMLAQKIDLLQQEIYALAGEEFNINSPKQLGVILFEKLGLPVVKKTKSGYSTNVEVLEKLEDRHEIISKIMEYRTYTKLKSTYADGLYHVIDPSTGKIHSSFNQAVTTTGRISSTEPNLQNIPVRLELGREIRKMFIASDDEHVLVDADYSQIELRVLAHIASDEAMIEAFKNGADIHAITASQVFHMPLDAVTSSMRTRAKAVNFGIVYGIGEFSLAKDLHVTRKVAAEYIHSYFEKYQGIHAFIENTVAFAKENGYVTTALGRRRYIPELKSSNFNLRAFGERVAMNAPIQGYAADIIKIAMVKVYERLQKEGLSSKLILQVHDELIIDAVKTETERVKAILKEEMEHAVTLSVPLIVDMKTGNSWYDTK